MKAPVLHSWAVVGPDCHNLLVRVQEHRHALRVIRHRTPGQVSARRPAIFKRGPVDGRSNVTAVN